MQVDLGFFFIFLINFILYFHLLKLHLSWNELYGFSWFAIFKDIPVSWPNYRFCKLTLTQVFFILLYNVFFLSILSLNVWVYWEINFIICFNLLSMRLSWSYNLDYGFCRLTQLTWVFYPFFYWFFFNFIFQHLSWLGINFHNLFWFVFYEVVTVSWLKLKVWQVNQGWLRFFFYHFLIKFFFNFVI